jgi:hypothetical protein
MLKIITMKLNNFYGLDIYDGYSPLDNLINIQNFNFNSVKKKIFSWLLIEN